MTCDSHLPRDEGRAGTGTGHGGDLLSKGKRRVDGLIVIDVREWMTWVCRNVGEWRRGRGLGAGRP